MMDKQDLWKQFSGRKFKEIHPLTYLLINIYANDPYLTQLKTIEDMNQLKQFALNIYKRRNLFASVGIV